MSPDEQDAAEQLDDEAFDAADYGHRLLRLTVVTGSDDLADLATASRAIAETGTPDELLGVLAELARELIGSREAEVRHLTGGSNLWRSSSVVSREPEGEPVLEAPLLRGDGTCMGVIRLAGKRDRSAWFSPDDERLLTMLGQIASATISHVSCSNVSAGRVGSSNASGASSSRSGRSGRPSAASSISTRSSRWPPTPPRPSRARRPVPSSSAETTRRPSRPSRQAQPRWSGRPTRPG